MIDSDRRRRLKNEPKGFTGVSGVLRAPGSGQWYRRCELYRLSVGIVILLLHQARACGTLRNKIDGASNGNSSQ